MDELGNLASGQNTALLVLTFLQADCGNAEYRKEILSLGQEINLTWDINWNSFREDKDLETDGHLSTCVTGFGFGVEPSLELQQPGECSTKNILYTKLCAIGDVRVFSLCTVLSPCLRPLQEWIDHLSWEVNRLMGQNVTFKDLAQEQVIVALTLTLVKGVCKHTPQLLRNLFNTALRTLNRKGSDDSFGFIVKS
uniref:BH3-interacting domain death agonist n=1 Tax=Mola mola TaxID=94237 RepID=A0A3Q3VJ22_MOLML